MDIKIRKVEIGDAEAVRDISTEGLGYSCDLTLVQKKIAGLDAEREAVFVAVADGGVVGYIHIERYDVLLRSPAEVEGNEGFPPPLEKDLDSPSSKCLEALVPSLD